MTVASSLRISLGGSRTKRGESRCWRRWLFGLESAAGLSLFRILFGIYLVCYFARFVPSAELVFSNRGVYAPLLLADYAPGPACATALVASAVLIASCLTIGWQSRLMGTLMLIVYCYHYLLNLAATGYSYDRLNLVLLLLLLLGDSGARFSLDALRRGQRLRIIRAAPALIRLEIAFMYFGSGLVKLMNPTWRDGNIIKMTFTGSWSTELSSAIANLDPAPWCYDVAAWLVIAFELAMGPMLYSRRIRLLGVILGISFHASVWALLGIGEFLQIPATYVLFLAEPRDQQIGERGRT